MWIYKSYSSFLAGNAAIIYATSPAQYVSVVHRINLVRKHVTLTEEDHLILVSDAIHQPSTVHQSANIFSYSSAGTLVLVLVVINRVLCRVVRINILLLFDPLLVIDDVAVISTLAALSQFIENNKVSLDMIREFNISYSVRVKIRFVCVDEISILDIKVDE